MIFAPNDINKGAIDPVGDPCMRLLSARKRFLKRAATPDKAHAHSLWGASMAQHKLGGLGAPDRLGKMVDLRMIMSVKLTFVSARRSLKSLRIDQSMILNKLKSIDSEK